MTDRSMTGNDPRTRLRAGGWCAALLALLVENHDRLVSKNEIIERVWEGRAVSDAAISSRVKSARQALGDDGQAQRFIKTHHGRGFRFVADVRLHRGFRRAENADVPSSVHLRVKTSFRSAADKRRALPAYEYDVMAPQRWKVSDWKNARLAEYVLLVKGITIYRGDGTPIPRDVQLGNLRDTYYEAAYGSLVAP